MDLLRKAAQMALEALDGDHPDIQLRAAITLRAALAQPEPFNPDWDRVKALEESLREHMAEIQRLKALAQPEQLVVGGDDLPTLTKWTPQRKPLTDELIDILARSMVNGDKSVNWLCRVIEKAHGIE